MYASPLEEKFTETWEKFREINSDHDHQTHEMRIVFRSSKKKRKRRNQNMHRCKGSQFELLNDNRYPMRTIVEVTVRFPNAKFFTVLHAYYGFCRIRMD